MGAWSLFASFASPGRELFSEILFQGLRSPLATSTTLLRSFAPPNPHALPATFRPPAGTLTCDGTAANRCRLRAVVPELSV